MENNIFGNPDLESKRSLNDFFVVKPFSVLNTTEASWMRRKAWWINLLGDRGKSRENTLYKKSEGETTKIGKMIQGFNDGVSLFDPVLSEILVRWFSEPNMVVLDPFAGDESRGFVSCYLKRKYIGIELRKEQVDLNVKRLQDNGFKEAGVSGVNDWDFGYITDTSEKTMEYVKPESVDYILTCSPYLWIEKYSDSPLDLSNMNRDKFFDAYKNILQQCFKALKSNRFAALVTSEVRDKDGSYTGLVPKTIAIMEQAGFKYYNEMILVSNVGTLRFRVGGQMNSGRKVGRMHQNILIFYKGDMSKIKENFSTLIGGDE